MLFVHAPHPDDRAVPHPFALFANGWEKSSAQSAPAATPAARANSARAAASPPHRFHDRGPPNAAARAASAPSISTASECPCSKDCRIAVSTPMATSPAIFSVPRMTRSEGNESTSVGLFLPRKRRFKSRIAASLVTSTVTCPRSRTAACARVKNCANVRTEGSRSGATGDFRPGAAAAGPAEGFAETGFGGRVRFQLWVDEDHRARGRLCGTAPP